MNIPSVSCVSFGKLYISRDKKTQNIMKNISMKTRPTQQLRDVFEDFNEDTGDIRIVVSAKENKRRGEYTLYANKGDRSWKGTSVTYPSEGQHVAAIRKLGDLCFNKIVSSDAKTKSKNEAEQLIYDYTEKRQPMADPLELIDIGVWPWGI